MSVIIPLILSILSIVFVVMLYVLNSSRTNSLLKKTYEHESKITQHAVIQDSKLVNLAESINDNKRLTENNKSTMKDQIDYNRSELNDKLKNIENNIDQVRGVVKDNLEVIDNNMKTNLTSLHEKTLQVDALLDEHSRKQELETLNNVNTFSNLNHMTNDRLDAMSSLFQNSFENRTGDIDRLGERISDNLETGREELLRSSGLLDDQINRLSSNNDIRFNDLESQFDTSMRGEKLTRDAEMIDINKEISALNASKGTLETNLTNNYLRKSDFDNFKTDKFDNLDHFFTTLKERIETDHIHGMKTNIDLHKSSLGTLETNVANVTSGHSTLRGDFDTHMSHYEILNEKVDDNLENLTNLSKTLGQQKNGLFDITIDALGNEQLTSKFALAGDVYNKDRLYTKTELDALLVEHAAQVGPQGRSIQKIELSDLQNSKKMVFQMLDPANTENPREDIEVDLGMAFKGDQGLKGDSFGNVRLDRSDNKIKYDSISHSMISNGDMTTTNDLFDLSDIRGVGIKNISADVNKSTKTTDITIELDDYNKKTFQIPNGKNIVVASSQIVDVNLNTKSQGIEKLVKRVVLKYEGHDTGGDTEIVSVIDVPLGESAPKIVRVESEEIKGGTKTNMKGGTRLNFIFEENENGQEKVSVDIPGPRGIDSITQEDNKLNVLYTDGKTKELTINMPTASPQITGMSFNTKGDLVIQFDKKTQNGSDQLIVTMPVISQDKLPELNMFLNTKEGLCIHYGEDPTLKKKCIAFAELKDAFYTKSEYPIVDDVMNIMPVDDSNMRIMPVDDKAATRDQEEIDRVAARDKAAADQEEKRVQDAVDKAAEAAREAAADKAAADKAARDREARERAARERAARDREARNRNNSSRNSSSDSGSS